MNDDLVIFGWQWFKCFQGGVINGGTSCGLEKPNLKDSIDTAIIASHGRGEA